MSRTFRALKIVAVPLLFAAAALGLATVHISLERKAARAKHRAAQAVTVQDSAGKLAGIRLQDLAPAARKGDVPAEVEMARRLALGEGVKKDEAQAALYFQSAVGQLGEIGAHDKRAPVAATAYRFLAQFYRRGVPAAHIAANPAYAFDLLHHAASYFGDPTAQYELAKLHLDGDGVSKNTRVAAQWLLRAARKGYPPAQALLGDMLWRGNGVRRVPEEGLGLLGIARKNASPADKVWVSKMYEAARAEALPVELLKASAFIVQESGASPFAWPSGGFTEGDTLEGADSAGKAAPAAQPAGTEQSTAVHGSSQLLQGSQTDPELADRGASGMEVLASKGGKTNSSAGMIQMYRVWGLQGSAEASSPVRLAGMAK